MREQFDVFKERLARTVQESPFSPPPTAPPGATNTTDGEVGSSGAGSGGREGRVLIGEMVSKSERRAGEDPSGIKSGILRLDAHPIPVTFTSLPGFPLFPRTTTVGSAGVGVGGVPASVGTVTGDTTAVPGVGPGTSVGTLTPVRTDPATVSRGPGLTRVPGGVVGTRLTGVAGGGFRRTPSGTSEGDSNGVGNLMRLLESRLIGGIRGATTTTSPIQHFDPSIVVNFLTLVALSQQQRRGGSGSSAPGQRNAALAGGAPLTLPTSAAGSEFGPFSTGDDPSAGVDPSSILLPPMLRQTLYSYLLPRLASLTALVETIPGVPGLDYPIISTVPYTNFYCSDMPWPGFYADTEARCQVWHYCDLDGRQASFLCPNGTMFNQAFFVCDWWYNLDCQSALTYSSTSGCSSLPGGRRDLP
ncbi:uncharacterized protein LOC121879721, partial [Homarus americanus]|uniref:uncharacterized protein LOC121879721 n=1 Tax=Homarus americanus TaxID=6706 RepID=UPI001C44E84E